MERGILFDVDPTILTIGPIELRWYGVCFAAMFWIGVVLFHRSTRRAGYSDELVKAYLPWLFVGMVLGARLGHCLFYEPERYLSDPIQILMIWKGGLSSHGGTVGVLGSLFLFARFHGLRYVDLADRTTMPAAVAATLVRVGNLMNSEIVGARTELPFGFGFVRHDCAALDLCDLFDRAGYAADPRFAELVEATPLRHPTQIYEIALGLFVLGLMWGLDRRFGEERRPVGLLTGAFGMSYFGLRFFVEIFKARQALGEEAALTMGQYMSIPLFLIGLYLVVGALRRPEPAESIEIPAAFSSRPPAAAEGDRADCPGDQKA